jgi:hypothetical protein
MIDFSDLASLSQAAICVPSGMQPPSILPFEPASAHGTATPERHWQDILFWCATIGITLYHVALCLPARLRLGPHIPKSILLPGEAR